jgi:hypothetical protein
MALSLEFRARPVGVAFINGIRDALSPLLYPVIAVKWIIRQSRRLERAEAATSEILYRQNALHQELLEFRRTLAGAIAETRSHSKIVMDTQNALTTKQNEGLHSLKQLEEQKEILARIYERLEALSKEKSVTQPKAARQIEIAGANKLLPEHVHVMGEHPIPTNTFYGFHDEILKDTFLGLYHPSVKVPHGWVIVETGIDALDFSHSGISKVPFRQRKKNERTAR